MQNIFNAKPQRRKAIARRSRNQRSADSLVRGFLACGSGLADKAVRAPRKSLLRTTKFGDSTAKVGISIVSVTPGFSPVLERRGQNGRFNGFFATLKAAEAADVRGCQDVTGLKPSANETRPCIRF